MPLIYITGPTAAGKTTIGNALRGKGYEVHDTDDEGWRRWVNVSTGEIVAAPIRNALEDPEWHANHIYTIYDEPIKAAYAKAQNQTIFLCGTTQTDLDFAYYFSKIILLDVNEELQGKRIHERTNHAFGKLLHQFAAAQNWRPLQIAKYESAGAHKIDSTKPIEVIVQEILSLIR